MVDVAKREDALLDAIAELIRTRTRLEAEIVELQAGTGHYGGDGLCECECHPENHASSSR